MTKIELREFLCLLRMKRAGGQAFKVKGMNYGGQCAPSLKGNFLSLFLVIFSISSNISTMLRKNLEILEPESFLGEPKYIYIYLSLVSLYIYLSRHYTVAVLAE